MTRAESLRDCLTLWRWLEQHPECYHKGDCPGVDVGHMCNHCPCCQYAQERSPHGACSTCPLLSLWPRGCETDTEDTPWERWRDAWEGDEGVDIRRQAAKEIADAAEAELARMEGEP